MKKMTHMRLRATENALVFWLLSITFIVLFFCSCRSKQTSREAAAAQTNSDTGRSIERSKHENAKSADIDNVLDSVFEMVADALREGRYPSDPYCGFPIPNDVSLSDDIVEIAVQLDDDYRQVLVGGISRVDASELYPGQAAFVTREARDLEGRRVTIEVWRVRLNL